MEKVVSNPIELFSEWYQQWNDRTDAVEPSAMTLATCSKDGQPSARIVLLKGVDKKGFVFFTNYTSRKGHELDHNKKAALCFHWEELGKQVRIEGNVEKTSDHESDAYFGTRTRESQIGAWASKQSHTIKDPAELAHRIKEITETYKGQPVPRPPFWGGYRVVPQAIEFWQHGEHRLHTRLLYTKNNDGSWVTQLLYP